MTLFSEIYHIEHSHALYKNRKDKMIRKKSENPEIEFHTASLRHVDILKLISIIGTELERGGEHPPRPLPVAKNENKEKAFASSSFFLKF